MLDSSEEGWISVGRKGQVKLGLLQKTSFYWTFGLAGIYIYILYKCLFVIQTWVWKDLQLFGYINQTMDWRAKWNLVDFQLVELWTPEICKFRFYLLVPDCKHILLKHQGLWSCCSAIPIKSSLWKTTCKAAVPKPSFLGLCIGWDQFYITCRYIHTPLPVYIERLQPPLKNTDEYRTHGRYARNAFRIYPTKGLLGYQINL